MKNLKTATLFTACFVLMTFSSCSDDDSDSDSTGTNPPTSTSAIVFDGKTYNFVDGLTIDFGAAVPGWGSGIETHYNREFVMVDAPIIVIQDSSGEDYTPGASTSISLNVDLYSPDTSGFRAGTFNYIHEDSVNSASVKNKFYFDYSAVQLDPDGVTGDTLSGPEYEVVGGSVIVSGTSVSNYSLNMNLIFVGGRTLTGTYTGRFIQAYD